VIAAAAIAVAGCSSDTSAPATSASSGAPAGVDPALLAQAKQEGSFVIYGNAAQEQGEGLTQEFLKEMGLDGISVEYDRFTSAQLLQRFETEAAAGQIQADFIVNAYPSQFTDPANAKYFTTLTPDVLPALADYPEVNVTPTGVRYSVTPFAVQYNTDLVQGDDIPTKWEDLTDPKFKGQIILNDPRTNPAYNVELHYIAQDLGDDWLKAIGNSGYQLTASSVTGIQQLAAGGAKLLFPAPNQAQTLPEGSPVGFVVPDGVTFVAESWFGLVKDAAHPAIAQLYAQWLLSEQGREFACSQKQWNMSMNVEGIAGAENCPVRTQFQSITDTDEVAKVAGYAQHIYDLLNLK